MKSENDQKEWAGRLISPWMNPWYLRRRSGKISPARRLDSTGFEPEQDLSQNPYTRFSRVSAAVTPNSYKQVFNLLDFFLLLAALLCAFDGNFPRGALTSRCACVVSRFLSATKPRPLFRILQYTKGEIRNSCVSFHAAKTCFPSGKIFNFHPAALLGLRGVYWSYWTDSNRRPADYKAAALQTELQ